MNRDTAVVILKMERNSLPNGTVDLNGLIPMA